MNARVGILGQVWQSDGIAMQDPAFAFGWLSKSIAMNLPADERDQLRRCILSHFRRTDLQLVK
jgi:hypothetical protein